MTNKSSKVISCLDDIRDIKERLFKRGKRKFPWSYEQIIFERERKTFVIHPLLCSRIESFLSSTQ